MNMRLIKTLLTTFIFLVTLNAFSQEIVTDRPDQTESSVTVATGNLQIESGVSIANEGRVTSTFLPSTLLRYGIFEGVELRFVFQNESTEISLDGGNRKYQGFSDLEIGTKIQILKKENVNTEIAFLSHLIIPSAKTGITTDNFGVINKLSVSHSLSDIVGIGYNIGYDLVEKQSALTYSVALGISFSDKVGFYVEPYGSWAEQNDFESNFDLGITYLVRPNLQLDVSYGTGINNDMNYLSAGFSWEIHDFLKKNK